MLADIRIEFDGSDVNRVYPRDLPDLFDGGQLIVAGRYRDSGRTTLRLSGRIGDERRRFEFPVELAPAGGGSSYDFVERLWAVRRVGFIIDQVDLHGRSKELIDELVALSTRYGILTPYTSFLADETRPAPCAGRERGSGRSRRSIELENVSGAAGVGQRAVKQEYLDTRQARPVVRPSRAGPSRRHRGVPTRQRRQPGHRRHRRAADWLQAKRTARRGSPGQAVGVKDAEGNDTVAETVRQVGAKTFYFKDNGWVDSAVGPDELGKAVVLKQFSDDFFNLTRSQSAEQNQYFTFAERVTVKLDGKVYRVDPGTP